MTTEPVRRYDGLILGYVDTDDKGNQTVRDFYGVILGFYDAAENCTRNFVGQKLTQGNTAIGLIYKNANK